MMILSFVFDFIRKEKCNFFCKKIGIPLNVILLFFFSIFLFNCHQKPKPIIQQGVLDLSEWNFYQDGSVSLQGTVPFYWQQFISNLGSSDIPADGFAEIPGSWDTVQIKEKKIQADGYASYKLKIQFPQELVHKNISLNIPTISTSYDVYLDGKKVIQVGKIGTDRQSSEPGFHPIVYQHYLEKQELQIVFHVSNFSYFKSGLMRKIYIGPPDLIDKEKTIGLLYDYFLASSLFITGLYHIALFYSLKQNISYLHFGIFCLLFAVRTFVTGEYSLAILNRGIPFETQIRLDFFLTI